MPNVSNLEKSFRTLFASKVSSILLEGMSLRPTCGVPSSIVVPLRFLGDICPIIAPVSAGDPDPCPSRL